MIRNSSDRYGLAARGFHWLSALAVLLALFCIEITDFFPRGSAQRMQLIIWHINGGLLVGLLLVPRLLWRLGNPPPAITPPLSSMMRRMAHGGHGLLYLLMLLLPLLGMLAQQSDGKPVALFGWRLPVFIAALPDWHHLLRELHGLAGNLLLIMLVLHVLAALWHHRVLHDNTLTRLLGPLP